jgi:SAM-dependent methyltransferase
MKYTQRISENTGIEKDEFLPGYSAEDGLHFDEDSFLHTMMESMASFLINMHIVKNELKLKRVLDIGCGAGSLAYYMRKYLPTIEVFTLDGNCETINSPFVDKDYHFVVRTDQEYEIVDENNDIVKFDLIVSFEHLEHIQEENFEQFLKNVMKHSHEGTLFFSTAADWEHEEEGMEHVHCNVKNLYDWYQYIESIKTKIGLYRYCNCYNLMPYGKALGEAVQEAQYADLDGHMHLLQLESKEQIANLISSRMIEHWNIPESQAAVPFLIVEILAHFFVGGDEAEEDSVLSWAHRFASSVILLMFGPPTLPGSPTTPRRPRQMISMPQTSIKKVK